MASIRDELRRIGVCPFQEAPSSDQSVWGNQRLPAVVSAAVSKDLTRHFHFSVGLSDQMQMQQSVSGPASSNADHTDVVLESILPHLYSLIKKKKTNHKLHACARSPNPVINVHAHVLSFAGLFNQRSFVTAANFLFLFIFFSKNLHPPFLMRPNSTKNKKKNTTRSWNQHRIYSSYATALWGLQLLYI